MLKFDVNIKPEEYIKLNYKLIYTSPIMLLMNAGGLIWFLFNVLQQGFIWANIGRFDNLIPVLIIGYLWVLMPITLFYRIRGLYYRLAALNEEQRYTVDEAGVNIKGKTFTTKNEWAAYKSIQVKHGWMILWKAQNFGNFIPLNSFTNVADAQQLVNIAKEKGVQIKGKL